MTNDLFDTQRLAKPQIKNNTIHKVNNIKQRKEQLYIEKKNLLVTKRKLACLIMNLVTPFIFLNLLLFVFFFTDF